MNSEESKEGPESYNPQLMDNSQEMNNASFPHMNLHFPTAAEEEQKHNKVEIPETAALVVEEI